MQNIVNQSTVINEINKGIDKQPEQNKPLILDNLYELAMRAHSGTSFSPEKRGRQVVISYSEELEDDLSKINSEDLKEVYKAGYIKNISAWLSAKGRCISTMITGPANFPVRRAEKFSQSEHNRYGEFRNWRDNFFTRAEKAAERAKPEEQKLAERFELIKKNISSSASTIIQIDNGQNRYSSRPLFVSSITGIIQRIANEGNVNLTQMCLDYVKELNALDGLKKPIITAQNGIWKLLDQAETIQEKKEDKKQQENEVFQADGCEIVINYALDRIQIIHPEKPDKETIQRLKKSAFKWAPSQGAWQRQLTSNAKYAVFQITGLKV